MANQNLSQFTEKTFVADADWTFVWDAAGLISKKVSRNSLLSGTTADFHLGLADAAAPVAQTLSVQSVVAGTSNTAGVNFTINGSQGTGTGAGGSLLFRTAPAGSSGTTQNALSTALAITAAGNVGIGTTAPSSKLHVAETWNASGTAFTAAKIVVTDTASAAASNLLELWSGSTPALKSYVTKSGTFVGGVTGANTAAALSFPVSGAYSVGVYSPESYKIQFAMTSLGPGGAVAGAYLGLQYEMTAGVLSWGITAQDIVLARDGEADHLAMRRTTNGQKFSVYGTYPGAAWERFTITAPTSGNVLLGTYKGTGGIARGLEIQTDGVTRMTINSNGLTIGSLNIQPTNSAIYNAVIIGFGTNTAYVGSPSDGVLRITNNGLNGFNRLQFGGETASFPAIKRVGTDFQVVVANTTAANNVAAGDADLTFIEDRYRRKGAGTPEGVVTAPIGAVYHDTTGGAGTSFYVKESGTGNTGWVGK